jgi:hypothetical protein
MTKKLIKDHYTAERAAQYDANRNNSNKWKFEQAWVEQFINKNPQISSVSDAPLGTNRFSDVIENADNIKVFCGYELSEDMIKEAKKNKGEKLEIFKHNLIDQNIEKSSDLTLCFRMLNLLGEQDSLKILENVLQSSKEYCIFTLRCWDKLAVCVDGKIHIQNESFFIGKVKDCGFSVVDQGSINTAVDGDYKIFTVKRKTGGEHGANK